MAYHRNTFVCRIGIPRNAENLYAVLDCQNIPGRRETILFVKNVLTGESRQFAKSVVETVTPDVAKVLVDSAVIETQSRLKSLNETLQGFEIF